MNNASVKLPKLKASDELITDRVLGSLRLTDFIDPHQNKALHRLDWRSRKTGMFITVSNKSREPNDINTMISHIRHHAKKRGDL